MSCFVYTLPSTQTGTTKKGATMTKTPRPIKLDETIAVLERTPASLKALLGGLPEVWIRATEGDGTWSPYDVIGHLIHGERTDWISRIRHIIEEIPRPFDTFDRTAHFKESEGKDLTELLKTFERIRKENLETLRDMRLMQEDLTRQGMHPQLGEVTLGQLIATWAVHDLDHIGQIARTMAKVYANQTGPWSAYLSILRDRE